METALLESGQQSEQFADKCRVVEQGGDSGRDERQPQRRRLWLSWR